MYKPNFCADCGARIARTRWRPWTSRRFCAACEGRFRGGRLLLPLAAAFGLLAAGFAAGRLTRPSSAPLAVKTSAPVLLAPAPLAPSAPAKANSTGGAPDAPAAPRYGADGTAQERPTDPGEVVSVCGARTKKGTPCQRRVRGAGRCWQHRGRAAMLPPGKLVVSN